MPVKMMLTAMLQMLSSTIPWTTPTALRTREKRAIPFEPCSRLEQPKQHELMRMHMALLLTRDDPRC